MPKTWGWPPPQMDIASSLTWVAPPQEPSPGKGPPWCLAPASCPLPPHASWVALNPQPYGQHGQQPLRLPGAHRSCQLWELYFLLLAPRWLLGAG